MKLIFFVNSTIMIQIGSLLKSKSNNIYKRAIGVVDDEEEVDDSAKVKLLQDINIEIPEVEELANKVS